MQQKGQMLILKQFRKKLAAYFKQRLGMFDYRRGWLKGDCPSCNKEKKFGVNIDKNRTNCFVCEYNKSPIDTVCEIEGFKTRHEGWDFIKTFEDVEYLEAPVVPLKQVDVKLPESFKLLSLGSSNYSKAARNYMKSRGFDPDELSMKGIGYCTKGEYFGYIILPYYKEGKIVYFTTRLFLGNGSKFKNPKIEEFGIGKNMLIYNIDALNIYTKIYIVESITNALTIGDEAIALGGKLLSNYQRSCILRSQVEKLIVILDSDAMLEAIVDLALKLVYHKKIKIIKMPHEIDVNQLGKKKTMKLVNKAKYLNHRDLIVLKNKYEKTPQPTY